MDDYECFIQEKSKQCTDNLASFQNHEKIFDTIKLLNWNDDSNLTELKKKCSKLREEFGRFKREIERIDFKVGVVGLESSGKSSFINAYVDVIKPKYGYVVKPKRYFLILKGGVVVSQIIGREACKS